MSVVSITLLNILILIQSEINVPEFVDITAEVFGEEPIIGSFISVRDYDGDSLEDILIDNRLFKNVSYNEIYFYEVTFEAGIDGADGHGTFIDINLDGCPDIIFYGQNHKIQIYQNLCNGTFRRIEKFIGFENCEHTEAVGFIPHKDFRYGLIYCATYEYENRYYRDYLYASNGDFTFYDVTYLLKSDLIDKEMPSRCVRSGDVNNDNRVDFYVCNYRLFPNMFFLQNELGEFSNESFNLNASSFNYKDDDYFSGSHTICAAFADLNYDGISDIVLSNLAHNDYERGKYNKKSEILVFDKEAGRYRDRRVSSGIEVDNVGSNINGIYKDELFSGSLIADFDNDGLMDILFTQVYDNSYSYSRFFKGVNTSPFFVESTYSSGILFYDSLGAVYADLNGDGCMDIISAGKKKKEKNRRLMIFENRCNYKGDFIQFKLIGNDSTMDTLGSKVRILFKKDNERRVLMSESTISPLSFGQQNTEILHFGLGNNYEIERIEIDWITGVFQILYNFKINVLNYIQKPVMEDQCSIDLINYDENYYHLISNCEIDNENFFAFLGNTCEVRKLQMVSNLIEKKLFKGNDFCKDYILLLNKKGVGIKKFIYHL